MKYKIDEATGLPVPPEEDMFWEIGDSETSPYGWSLIDGEKPSSTPAIFLKRSKTIVDEGVRNWKTLWLTKRTTTQTVERYVSSERYIERNPEKDEADSNFSHYDSIALTKENTLKLAEKVLDRYWGRLYSEALEEDADRTLKAERSKIYGKYPPRKLS